MRDCECVRVRVCVSRQFVLFNFLILVRAEISLTTDGVPPTRKAAIQ